MPLPISNIGVVASIDFLYKSESIALIIVFLALVVIGLPHQFLLGCTNSTFRTDKVNFVFLQISELANAVVVSSATKLLFIDGSPF